MKPKLSDLIDEIVREGKPLINGEYFELNNPYAPEEGICGACLLGWAAVKLVGEAEIYRICDHAITKTEAEKAVIGIIEANTDWHKAFLPARYKPDNPISFVISAFDFEERDPAWIAQALRETGN